jgi:hypothetical protein
MRFHANIDIRLPGEAVLRTPTFWERAKRAFGGRIDLTTNEVRIGLEATLLVRQVQHAWKTLNIDNAVALTIDDQVIYSDMHETPDDMSDLILAMGEHSAVFGGTFRMLRFAVEMEEAGLHAVIETTAYGRHTKTKPSATAAVSARIRELEALPGETAEAYRSRVEPMVANPQRLEIYRSQFSGLAAKLHHALRLAFPECEVTLRGEDAQIVKPSPRRAKEALPTLRGPTTGPKPGHRYDPMTHIIRGPSSDAVDGAHSQHDDGALCDAGRHGGP